MQISDLEQYGFNVSEGLELCADDEDIYMEVLETALEEGREKLSLFEELIQSEDWERYTIEAHGLKNAARQIGADNLSDMAKASEFAGKDGDIDTIKKSHEALLDEYSQVLDALGQLFAE